MSVDFTFNKIISFDDIKDKTNLKIEFVNGNYWVIDEHGNTMFINHYEKDNSLYIAEITSYGGKNSNKIRDIIIETFDAKFITDNEYEILCHSDEDSVDIEELTKSCMSDFGYIIDENDKVIIPNRSVNNYLPKK